MVSYGVNTDPNNRDIRDWTRFKEISQLKKPIYVLEEYFIRLISYCHEILYPNSNGEPMPEKDVDGMTPDKARKLLKRVEAMRKLREDVITNPKVF